MSKRLKGTALMDRFVRELGKHYSMFALYIHGEEPDGTLTFHHLTNILPEQGRKRGLELKAPGMRLYQEIRVLDKDGQIAVLVPAATPNQIEQDKVNAQEPAKVEKIDLGQKYEDRPKSVYKPGQGWVEE